MSKIILSIFILLSFLLCSCSQIDKEALVWFNKANALWDGEKYRNPKKAIEYLNKAIKLQPDFAQAFYNRGNAYYGLGMYHRAIKDYNETIRLKPKDVDAYHNRGNAYFIQGNKKQGCLDAQQACTLGDCKLLDLSKGKGLCH